MIVPPLVIRACPHCRSRLRERPFVRICGFGLVTWSDGGLSGLAPQRPVEVIRCRVCGGFVRVSEAEVLEQYDRWTLEALAVHPSRPTQDLRALTYMECLEAVSLRCWSTPEQERALRTQAWQAANDPCRVADGPRQPEYAGGDLANTDALLDLLDVESSEDRIMAVEIERLRGRFTEAERLLWYAWERRHSELALKQSRWVAEESRELKVLEGDPRLQSPPSSGGWRVDPAAMVVLENGRFRLKPARARKRGSGRRGDGSDVSSMEDKP